MRSRDGDHSFTFSTAQIIFFLLLCSSALFADEYLISYRYLVKNAALYNETLDISKAMKPCQGTTYTTIQFPRENNESLKEILQKNSELFHNFLAKIGFFIDNKEETYNGLHTSTTILTLKTTCFKVDFNDNFVKISPLK